MKAQDGHHSQTTPNHDQRDDLRAAKVEARCIHPVSLNHSKRAMVLYDSLAGALSLANQSLGKTFQSVLDCFDSVLAPGEPLLIASFLIRR